ncbi:hypothetical protein EYF80_048400 [Liparis tanakae]|uniref:Uncharacterized protein n=1 Tax=Liparis tanakae TaxID=230148 RepID=A0A4Z2FJX0_9TELE|nr:hypothetical protein EYF80_048400 [Liparis tanakae]
MASEDGGGAGVSSSGGASHCVIPHPPLRDSFPGIVVVARDASVTASYALLTASFRFASRSVAVKKARHRVVRTPLAHSPVGVQYRVISRADVQGSLVHPLDVLWVVPIQDYAI